MSAAPFLWPDKSCRNVEIISEYERRLRDIGKCFFLYCNVPANQGVCASTDLNKRLTEIFLKYGIRIADKLKKIRFLPLGFGYPTSFGFGAFCVNDWNIPNNCPLVLWWGDIDNPQSMVGSWYPLFPRRDNKKLYQNICQYEEKNIGFLRANIDVLKTVYHLSMNNYSKHSTIDEWNDIITQFDIDKPRKMRDESNLYQYLKRLDMETIKLIQTVMYIGRDYTYEGDIEGYYSDYDDEKPIQKKSISLKVDAPDSVFSTWFHQDLCAKLFAGSS